MLADRVAVEQRLGRVLVPAVAGVDRPPASPSRRPAQGAPAEPVAHDDRVDAHRLDRLDGVAQRLALLHRRRADAEVHRVGRQPLGRGLEAAGCGSSPRRRATRRSCPAAPAPSGSARSAHLDEAVGESEHLVDAVGAEVVDRRAGASLDASPRGRRRRR